MNSGDETGPMLAAWGVVLLTLGGIFGAAYVGAWVPWVMVGIGVAAILVWLALPSD